jgi:hypothetical protein
MPWEAWCLDSGGAFLARSMRHGSTTSVSGSRGPGIVRWLKEMPHNSKYFFDRSCAVAGTSYPLFRVHATDDFGAGVRLTIAKGSANGTAGRTG